LSMNTSTVINGRNICGAGGGGLLRNGIAFQRESFQSRRCQQAVPSPYITRSKPCNGRGKCHAFCQTAVHIPWKRQCCSRLEF
jgi:hypothetical protein